MASESVGANENSDLTALETPRLVEYTKVYTRKFRRRPQLDRSTDGPATTATASAAASETTLAVASSTAEPPVSASPAKSLICNDDDVLKSSPRKDLVPKDGSFSQQPEKEQSADSLSEAERGSDDNLHRSEEGKCGSGDGERLPPGGQETPPGVQPNRGQETPPGVRPNRGQETPPRVQPNRGQETTPDGQEEPRRSSSEHSSPEMQTPGGREQVPDDTEELPVRGVLETQSELQALPDGREELPSRSGQEVVSKGDEVPQPTGAQEVTSNLEKDLQHSGGDKVPKRTGGQEVSSNCEEDLQCSGVQADVSNAAEARQPLNNGREEPLLNADGVPHSFANDRLVNDGARAALVNGKPVVARVEDRIRINLSESTTKDDIRGVKRKLEGELLRVSSLVRKLEAKELQFTACNTSSTNNNANCAGGIGSFGAYNQPQLMRVHSDVGSIGRPQLMRFNSEVGTVGRQGTRPFRHLTVSLTENNHSMGEFVEKEKRTPKANQYYRNSEFLLGKDRLPPENKRLKPNGAGKKHGGESDYQFGFGFGVDKNRDKVFKSCTSLLMRLMKHKHGWVFNEPVDAEKLCIPDYHDIIKHPMDFGTIKTRLSQNWYKSPREFAEDVRLVFSNAMTYNPKGQDVHTMAEELSKMFEEKWATIQKEYFPYQMYRDAGLPVPTPRRAPPPLPTTVLSPVPAPVRSAPPIRTLDRSESMTIPVDSKLKPNFPPSRTPVPKKPKAKDPNKRDMTYEEKQKLSTNLQSLPAEKLDAIVQIIKKRNTTMSQHDDEIEVDIDSVDAETLWELDRFVTNYKKSLSKIKRRAELALKAAQAVPIMNTAVAAADAQKENRIGENTDPSPAQGEKQGDNVSVSSSSSSSSSDSGSSSSDSDTDSSSAYGSDAGRSPRG